MVTNAEFARLTGCNYTMASKIRNGARMPSGALFSRIVRVFDLNGDAAVEAYAGGRSVFSDYIEREVFSAGLDETEAVETA